MTLEASILEDLRVRLASGELPHGQRVRPENICKSYGCSASAMRETLLRLSADGLVEYREQRGFRVPEFSQDVLDDLIQFRIMLESEGACMSIRKGGVAWESRLAGAHHKLSHIENTISGGQTSHDVMALWAAAELEFHQTLIEACGSDVLKSSHATVYFRFRQQNVVVDREFEFLEENIQQHSGILAAALAHDEELVCKRISEHLWRNFSTEAGVSAA